MQKDIFNKEEALTIYRKLMLARLSEEKIREEYFKDEMKTPVHLGIGGEAIPVGVSHAVPQGTTAFATYRNHSLYLAMTEDTDGFFGELYGKASGPGKGKAGSMHISAPEKGFIATSAVVGTTVPLAVGRAFANAYKKSDELVTVYFGDGAVEEGAFWESLNFACLKRLKVLFICEDNELAIHTASTARQGFTSITEAAGAFKCHVAKENGCDVQKVVQTTRDIVKKMKEDPKPAFLHFDYFRFLEHVGPREDFDAGYREKPHSTFFEAKDPVPLFEKDLLQSGCTRDELDGIKKNILTKINNSVVTAQQAPFPLPEELFTDIFS
ncbi:MAG: thiamine pyrophosphate-dependent dehydrogenase E1 component subunit alpha [Deltaproteobacteria bacterium]|nr:thiamine pyrophosphate-dependent dehydrogenase E1 component subunit alpha [Deltaproteobacteria bacterium]